MCVGCAVSRKVDVENITCVCRSKVGTKAKPASDIREDKDKDFKKKRKHLNKFLYYYSRWKVRATVFLLVFLFFVFCVFLHVQPSVVDFCKKYNVGPQKFPTIFVSTIQIRSLFSLSFSTDDSTTI